MKFKVITGIVLTLLLISMLFSTVPVRSAPAGIMLTPPGVMSASAGIIKIGVVGPYGSLQWDGLWEGAQMARDEINDAGGINIGEAFYNIELVAIDEHSVPTPDPYAAVAELVAALASGVDFLIGGFRTECVFPMCEAAMDYHACWIIAGASTDSLMEAVGTDYERYKYMFRVAPVNSTYLAASLISFLAGWILPHTLIPLYGSPVNTYIVAEDLVWCDAILPALQYYLDYTSGLYPVCNFVGVARPSPLETDFSLILEDVKAKDARLLIHLFSAEAGASFISQWRDMEVEAVPVGINVVSQKNEFWEQTEGKCEHETILAVSGTRTPLSAGALAFYDEILSRYGHSPIYTSWGAYEAIYTLAEAVERAGTTDSDTVVAELEQTDRNGILGRFKFTEYHDVFCNEIGEDWEEGYVRPLVVQWQKSPITGEARLEVVYPRKDRAASFSKKWKIPTRIYSLAETDLNLDGMVSLFDLILVAYYWEKKAGDPEWNSDYDVDGNGIIDIADLSRVAKDLWQVAEFGASMGTALSIPKITQTNSETTVYLDPPTINGTAIGVNNTVKINLNISDALDIYSWQAGLTFNATLLECTEFVIGEFLQIGTWYGQSGVINNTSGEVTPHACTLSTDNNASGDGRLAYATFKVKAPGISDLHLRDVKVMNSSNVLKMVPFNIIDIYTVVRSAAQTVFTVSNSTGVEPDGFEFVDENKTSLIVYGSGFYDHAFSRPDEEVSFNVTGPYPGFSNITIPKTLLNVSTPDKLLVIINDIPLKTEERTVTENLTHYSVYFKYTLGIHNIRILKRPPVYNINTNLYYATIQEAINSAKPEHKILAHAGKHYENVVVNKTVSLFGENKHNTTIDGSGTGTAIKVTADNVTISGFTIQNSRNPECGILVDGSSGNNISHNIITNNYYGIRLVNSSNNPLAGNNVSNNEYGILLDSSNNNTLTNNIMWSNKYNFGLYSTIETHLNNTIDKSNTVDGKPVYYIKKTSNTVYNLSTNAGTLYFIDCKNVTISNLTLTKNVNGIFLWNTTNSKIQNVNASNNLNGIYLQSQSNNNNLTDNTISNNELGIYLHSSNSSAIYHNSFIGNTIQAKVAGSYNTLWENGYPSGGNYWSDHSITYPFVVDEYKGENQNVQGNDGIIDDPKVIDKKNQDNYPLVSPLTPPVYNLNSHRSYAKIQEAIDATETSNGHMIIARARTYSEQVTINKSLTLIGIMGSTVINGTGTVVTVTENNVTLRGFTILGSGSTNKSILLSHVNNVVISENTITKKEYGIWLDQSHNCHISGNTLNNNTMSIHLQFSDSATISRNSLTNNSYGIVLDHSDSNDIHCNNVTYNDVGITLSYSSNNTIYHNNFINNEDQVYLFESPNTWNDGELRLCPVCGSPQPKGNYWSDYMGLDNGTQTQAHNCPGDGVGDTDTPHLEIDKYPLMSPRTPQHDVAVITVTPSQTVVASTCRTISITVTVENQGDYTEKFNVTVYCNDTAILPPNGKNYTTITLTSESFPPITLMWNATGFSCGNYTITAYANTVLGETETTDNSYTDGLVLVTVAGDVNGDGKVGASDIILVGYALFSISGDSNYNPNADVNGDGKIGSADIIVIGNHLFETCP